MAEVTKKQILLGGSLGQMFGRVHWLAVHSVAEAVRALTILYPEIGEKIREGRYLIFSGKRNLGPDQLAHPNGQNAIRIVPVLAGRKAGVGVFQIVIGVVLLVVGVFMGGTTWGPALAMMGAGLAVSGALMMLSPQATTGDTADKNGNKASYAFNGAVNTEAQGNPVPLAYGDIICGSAVVSGGIYSEDRAQ